MAEDIKVGGVVFSVGMDESDLEQSLASIKKRLKEGAEDAEEIYRNELKNIHNAINKAMNDSFNGISAIDKEIQRKQVSRLRQFRGELEQTFEVTDSMFRSRTLGSDMLIKLSPKAKESYVNELTKLHKEANQALGTIEIGEDKQDGLSSRYNLEQLRIAKEIEAVESKIKDFTTSEDDVIRAKGEVLKVQREQLYTQKDMSDYTRDIAKTELANIEKVTALTQERLALENAINNVKQKLALNPADSEASGDMASLLGGKLAVEQEISDIEQLMRIEKQAYKEHAGIVSEKAKLQQAELKLAKEGVIEAERAVFARQTENARKLEIDKAHYQALQDEARRNKREMDSIHQEANGMNKEFDAKKKRELDLDKAHYLALQENAKRHEAKLKAIRDIETKQLEAQRKREYDIDKAHYRALQEEKARNQKKQEALDKQALKEQKENDSKVELGRKNFSNMSGDIAKLGAVLATVTTVLAGRNIYDLIIGNSADFERTVNSFGLLIGDTERATEVMNDLKQLAYETPYNVIDLSNSANTLASTDLYISAIEDLVPRLGDLAKGNSDKLKDITKATMDIVNAGKVMGQELNQLKDSGVPIIPEMAKALGVTNQQFRKMTEQGKVSSQVYLDTVRQMTNEGGKFYGMMDTFSKDYLGRLEQVKSKFLELGMAIGDRTLKDLTGYLEDILDKFDEMEQDGSLDKVIQDWSAMLGLVAKLANNVAQFVAGNPELISTGVALTGILTALGGISVAFNSAVDAGKSLKAILVGISGAMGLGKLKTSALETITAIDGVTASMKKTKDAEVAGTLSRSAKNAKAGVGGALAGGAALAATAMPYITAAVALAATTWATLEIVDKAMEASAKKRNEELKQTVGTVKSLEKIQDDVFNANLVNKVKEDTLALESTIIGLKELTMQTTGVLSEDDFARQTDLIEKLKDLGMDVTLFDIDKETNQIKNFDSALKEMSVTFSEDFGNGLVSELREKLAKEEKFIAKVEPELTAKGDRMATRSGIEDIYGREVKDDEFHDIMLRLDARGYERTYAGVLKMHKDGVADIESNIKEGIDKVKGEIEEINLLEQVEYLNEGIKKATASAETLVKSMALTGSTDVEFIATLSDEEALARFEALKRITVDGGKDISAELTKNLTEATAKLIPNSTTYDNDLENYIGALNGMMDELTMKMQAGDITLDQYKMALEYVREMNTQTMQDFATGMGELGNLPPDLIAKINGIADKGSTDIVSRFKKAQEDINALTFSVGVVVEDRGLKSQQEVNALLGNVQRETEDAKMKALNEKVKRLEKERNERTSIDTAPKKTKDQLATEAYSLLTRQFEVEMVSTEQFKAKAEAIRNRYFKKGTLEYKEYTAKITAILDAQRQEEEQKEQERLEREKKALDNKLKLSEEYILRMSYGADKGSKQFYEYFNDVAQREQRAYKAGVQSYEEYTESVQAIGASSYDARMKQHEDYIAKQEMANQWSYGKQIAYYDKMSSETKDFYRKGVIDFATYSSSLQSIQDRIYDTRQKQAEKLMADHLTAIEAGYKKEVKAINDYYDAIDRKQEDNDRQTRLKELLALEKQYAGATNKGAIDRLKAIRDEIKDIKDDVAKQKLDDERTKALEGVDKRWAKFEDTYDKSMNKVGSLALKTSQDIGKAVDAMIKSFGKLDDFNLNTKYTTAPSSKSASSKGSTNIVNNINVNTVSATKEVLKTTGIKAGNQMAVGKKK